MMNKLKEIDKKHYREDNGVFNNIFYFFLLFLFNFTGGVTVFSLSAIGAYLALNTFN